MAKVRNTGFQDILLNGMMDNDSDFIPIISDGDEDELKNIDIPDVLPVLPLRNTVLFPGVVLPITVGRKKSLKLIRDVYQGSKLLGTLAQKDYTIDDPKKDELFEIGTVA
ncbi:MAG: LON peptidase substrate-binding domain-containing protein, partial [Tangfeifania sp.]